MTLKKIIVICIDGWDAEYLDYRKMDFIETNKNNGFTKIVNSMMPSVTNVNNISILTGQYPSKHGICSNYNYSMKTNQGVYLEENKYIQSETIFDIYSKNNLTTLLATSKNKLKTLILSNSNNNTSFSAEKPTEKDIIDFGMGNPDMASPKHIRDKLKETIDKPGVGRYSISRGIKGLRKAQANYYQRRFDVNLDPDSEIIVTLGSKEGLANLAQAITSKGDKIICPDPSYPVHPYGFMIAGAKLIPLQTIFNGSFNQEKYLSKLEMYLKNNPSVKAIISSFPSNPTAQVVSLDFYKELIKLAFKYDVFV